MSAPMMSLSEILLGIGRTAMAEGWTAERLHDALTEAIAAAEQSTRMLDRSSSR